jgi:hypothetical protein
VKITECRLYKISEITGMSYFKKRERGERRKEREERREGGEERGRERERELAIARVTARGRAQERGFKLIQILVIKMTLSFWIARFDGKQ